MSAREILEPELTFTDGAFERGLRIAVDELGRVAALGALEARPTRRLPGIALLPGFVNAHSHAFQRGLRGRGERFPTGAGSFWTWREAMYALASDVDEDSLYALALRAFREMLSAGITTVGEFHYLHHADAAARDHRLDEVVLRAAREAGIRIVLLSAYYATGGIGKAPEPAQLRFVSGSPEEYWHAFDRLLERRDKKTQDLGAVVHSVRAAPPDEIAAIAEGARARGLVLHLHVEEQERELAECRAAYGLTPMGLLLERGIAAPNVCAVHCTHTSEEDLARFLDAGGRVCVAPTTEANLADGLPDLRALRERPGRLALGTDSNARISMLEELRWLEYGQRLRQRERGALRRGAAGLVALPLLEAATRGGAAALGLAAGAIESGCYADFVAVDLAAPALAGVAEDELLEALVFGCDERVIEGVYVGGRRVAGRD